MPLALDNKNEKNKITKGLNMKKLSLSLFSFVLLLAGAFLAGGLLPIMPARAAEEDEIYINQNNFVEVFSNQQNYSKNLTLTCDIDFSTLENAQSIYSTSKTFTGTFDGRGYTISNLILTSSDNNFGLFSQTQNATIKNLKLDGQITFNFSDNLSVNAGTLVGLSRNTTIENCLIGGSSTPTILANADQTLQTKASTILGGLVGYGQDTNISNCLSYAQIELISLPTFSYTNYVGGLVGQQIGGNITNSVSGGNISDKSAQPTSNDLKNICGGIVGQISGQNAEIRNTMFIGTISSQDENSVAAIAGDISSLNTPKNGNIEYSYWSAETLKPYPTQSAYQPLDSTKLKPQLHYGSDFFADTQNWYPLSKGWDFDLTWVIKNSNLRLQQFETFDFALSNMQNSILSSVKFKDQSTNTTTISAKFGQEVTIELEIKEEFAPYYQLSHVSVNNVLTSNFEAVQIENDDKIIGYQVKLISSDMTDGIYSFDFNAIRFACFAAVDDPSQGGVKEKTGTEATDLLPLNLSYDSLPVTVVAEAKGIYTFTHWQLYLKDQDGNFQPSNASFDAENRSLEIKFGQAPFNREFVLKANFSSENAIAVKFNPLGTSQGIKSITLSGSEYNEEAIKVSSTNRSVVLRVVLNNGYKLDTNNLVAFLKNYYGTSPTSTIVRLVEEEREEPVYEFVLNMNAVSQNISDKQITIPLSIREEGNSNAKNLTWLYITLPIVAVVAAGTLTLIILLRRKRTANKLKKPKEDINDYYL